MTATPVTFKAAEDIHVNDDVVVIKYGADDRISPVVSTDTKGDQVTLTLADGTVGVFGRRHAVTVPATKR